MFSNYYSIMVVSADLLLILKVFNFCLPALSCIISILLDKKKNIFLFCISSSATSPNPKHFSSLQDGSTSTLSPATFTTSSTWSTPPPLSSTMTWASSSPWNDEQHQQEDQQQQRNATVAKLFQQGLRMIVQQQHESSQHTFKNFFGSSAEQLGGQPSQPYSGAMALQPIPYSGVRQPRFRSPTDMAERPFQCTYCNNRFKSKNNLRQHIRLHTGERPYVCNICNETFVQMSSLQHHKAKKHRERL